MRKMCMMICVCFFFWSITCSAYAWSVGDRVHVIFGSRSSGRVESGYITSVGDSNSKVEWDYCSNCNQWVSNSSFYSSYDSAKKARDEEDSNHTSLGEAAGAAAAAGLIYMWLNK